MFALSQYQYHLPEELIAQEAQHPHHDARLLVIDRNHGNIIDETTFFHLDEHLETNRVIFFNDSKVIPSRLILENISYTDSLGNKKILQNGEIFYLRSTGMDTFEALVKPGNKFKIGTTFTIGDTEVEVIGMSSSGRILKTKDIETLLTKYGSMPLPPYINYTKEKEKDYQTSFAKKSGSVAAPTASLHFTKELLEKIKNDTAYLTLHVGLGTFQGIQTADVRDYNIHHEAIEISLDILQEIAKIKKSGKKIVAVGTTATRTLESLPYLWMCLSEEKRHIFDPETYTFWQEIIKQKKEENWIHNIHIDIGHTLIRFETSIYITPGYTFTLVDDLITNFHLGGSSLLVLVSAFLGYENTMKMYQHAIKHKYRFYSFGDGMYIRGK